MRLSHLGPYSLLASCTRPSVKPAGKYKEHAEKRQERVGSETIYRVPCRVKPYTPINPFLLVETTDRPNRFALRMEACIYLRQSHLSLKLITASDPALSVAPPPPDDLLLKRSSRQLFAYTDPSVRILMRDSHLFHSQRAGRQIKEADAA